MPRAPRVNKPLGRDYETGCLWTAQCNKCGVWLYGEHANPGRRTYREVGLGAPDRCWARQGGRDRDERTEGLLKTNGYRCLRCGPMPFPPPGWLGEDGKSPSPRPPMPDVEPPSPQPVPVPEPTPTPAPMPEPSPRSDIDLTLYVTKVEHEASIASLRARQAEDMTAVLSLIEAGGKTLIVKVEGKETVKVEGAHVALAQVMRKVQQGFVNIWLYGPAGTGKSEMAKSLAKALSTTCGGLSFSEGTTEAHLAGRLLPTEAGLWKYMFSKSVHQYVNGGVLLWDEIDACPGSILVSVNSALANGEWHNPISGETHIRHKDCIILCAANTWGTGATAEYVGRTPLDAATLDRFVGAKVSVDYDRKLEMRLASQYGSDAMRFTEWVWRLRERVTATKLRRVISTRMVLSGARMLNSGLAPDVRETLDVAKKEVMMGWTADEMAKVSGI